MALLNKCLPWLKRTNESEDFRGCLPYLGNDLDLTHNTDDIIPLPDIETLDKENLILINIKFITLVD